MLKFSPLASTLVRTLQSGSPDANGLPAEQSISDGGGMPCRHCLNDIPKGAGMLILAHRPFEKLQPYAETGPIFLCEALCAAYDQLDVQPPILLSSPDYLLKGYNADERIVYGTGQITKANDIPAYAKQLLGREDIAFVDVRSARNNCYMCRISLQP